MKELHLRRAPIDKAKYVKRTALLSDVSQIIREDCIIYEDGQPIILYAKLKEDTSDLRWAAKTTKFSAGKRTQGLKQIFRTFGFSPRNPIRMNYCYPSSMSLDQPKQSLVLAAFAEKLQEHYKKWFPEKFKAHQDLVDEKVLSQWKIGDSPFTSGIINKNNPLKYHYDTGNFKGMLSNMVVFKSDVEGGHLVIPELDLALEVSDSTITIFNGQDILHGVSPIEYKNSSGYRFSVVYYSLEQMWKCDPIEEEIKRVRRTKTEREVKRLDPDHLESLKSAVTKQEKKNK